MFNLKYRIGQETTEEGYITTLCSVLVGGSRPRDQEAKLGFTPGSMSDGYWLLLLDPRKPINTFEFEFRGYSHLTDGKPTIEDFDPKTQTMKVRDPKNILNVHDEMNLRYGNNKIDQETCKRRNEEAVAKLRKGGLDRVCKVLVNYETGNVRYIPGAGVVQYVLLQPKTFIVAAFVGATDQLVGLGGDSVGVRPA